MNASLAHSLSFSLAHSLRNHSLRNHVKDRKLVSFIALVNGEKSFNIYSLFDGIFFSLVTPNMSQNNWKYYDLLGQICSFFPSVTGPLYPFQTLFYECKSASVGFTTDSILLNPKPFSAKHVEITCPLEKLTNVKLEETEALLFSCSQSAGPSFCSHLVSQQALIQGRKVFKVFKVSEGL